MLRRPSIVSLIAALLVPLIGFSGQFITRASAYTGECASDQSTGHCYAQMKMDNITNPKEHWWASVELDCANLYTNYSDEFLNEELWAYTGGSLYGAYWVEEGIQAHPYGLIWFWADNRSGHGYAEHDTAYSTSIGVRYEVGLKYIGSNEWSVRRNQTEIGVSTDNSGPSHGAQVGMEIHYNDDTGQGTATDLAYQNSGSGTSKHDGWNSNAYSFTDGSDIWGSLYSAWTSAYSAMEDGVSYCDPGLNPPATPNQESTASTDPIVVAKEFASQNGDASPTVEQQAAEPRSVAAADVFGAGTVVDSSQTVDVIVMRGAFTGNDASVPSGQPLPTGSSLTVLVDPSSGQITDWSLSNTAPVLSS